MKRNPKLKAEEAQFRVDFVCRVLERICIRVTEGGRPGEYFERGASSVRVISNYRPTGYIALSDIEAAVKELLDK